MDTENVTAQDSAIEQEEFSPKAKEIIAKRNKEAQERREALEKAQAEIASMKAKMQEMQDQREAAELKTVEDLRGKLTEKQTTLKAVEDRLEALQASIVASNDQRIAALPEKFRKMVPQYDDPSQVANWLTENEALLKVNLPDAGAGELGAGDTMSKKLPKGALEVAKKLGLSNKTLTQSLEK